MVEEGSQARAGDPLEAADQLHERRQEPLLLLACELKLTPPPREPDLLAVSH
jgi:hypothetical protein